MNDDDAEAEPMLIVMIVMYAARVRAFTNPTHAAPREYVLSSRKATVLAVSETTKAAPHLGRPSEEVRYYAGALP
ncbi:hypothetical protein GCM10007269_24250 [Microbacterium murale]|uniref:Uncharacterized protein n=1 Tax=Microbacterium murale TaxID=1081040 RepID=A0ABQ1RSW9_9MICO|nr:hypothetical protein GCM10007269_24250 [Microbacterium murale]